MVIWLTGLSGAGKTLISQKLVERFKVAVPELVHIDGDEVRALHGNDLAFDEDSRRKQIKRIQRLAKLLDLQGLLVVVAALYSHPELLDWNRANFDDYLEVYLSAPLALVQHRDAKGLYGKAMSGEMQHVVGMDIPWHAPANPDLLIDGALQEDPDALVVRIARMVPRLAQALAEEKVTAS
ncbi:MAG: adenylyl-sulfate kinase [Proteobacteria bacterium]|nr:adenylyl-sulfate kinase [Pseudomonadota bacterium]